MSKQEYTSKQIKELLDNPNIKSVSSKYITFEDHFKLESLKLDKEGLIHRDIFERFGFPKYIIHSKVPEKSLKNWRYKAKHKGIDSLKNTKKGRPKNEEINFDNMSLKEQNEYLKAENAYLKELKKLVEGKYP